MKEPRCLTWEDCAASGMTATEAARAIGRSKAAASVYAKRHGLTFRRDTSAGERMKAIHADPEFAERHRERGRERMKAMNADPEFAERNRERMKARHADPEFAERNRERMKARHADPARNPLVALTDAQRAEYDILVKRGEYSRIDALTAIGRGDLIGENS